MITSQAVIECGWHRGKCKYVCILIFPYRNAFTAVGTDVDVSPAFHQFAAELLVIVVVVPDLFEGLCLQVPQLMHMRLYQSSRAPPGHPR